MAVTPLAASVGAAFGQVREVIAGRWVVVACAVLALVALGQVSVSTLGEPVAADAPAAVRATIPYLALFPVIAGCFIALGASAFVLATDRVAARVFLGFAMAAAAALLAAMATPTGALWALEAECVSLAAVGASLPLLFLVFPINRLTSPAGRRVLAICLAGHATLVALSCGILELEPAWLHVLPTVWFGVLAADLAGAITLAIGVLVLAPPHGGRERRLLGLVALGTVAGLLPFPLFVVGPTLASDTYLLAPWIAIAGLVLLPASLGAAILSGQFLGIERIMRRGLVALLVWMALLGAYGLAVDQFGDEVGAWSEAPPSGWVLIVVAFIAGSFPIVQRQLRRGVEHVVFRDVYDYRHTLQQLGFEIVHLTSVERIAEHVLARLGQTLDLTWASISVDSDGDRGGPYCWGDCPATPTALSIQGAYVRPLVADGVPIGTLAVGPKRHDVELLPEDLSLIGTLAHLVATALQNALLVKRLEAQVAALADREQALEALSERLMRVQEEERRRLALDIHDDPLQRAILLARKMGYGEQPLDPEWCRRQAEEIVDALRAICSGLRPAELDDLGLVAGLDALVQAVRAGSDLDVSLNVDAPARELDVRLPPDLECALYRVAQEALNNCIKHASASRVDVRLSLVGARLTLRVEDDGRGFCGAAGGDLGRARLGILGMRERLRPWGGVVTIRTEPGRGTVVTAVVRAELPAMPTLSLAGVGAG